MWSPSQYSKNNNKLKTICIKYEQKSSIYLLFLFVTLMIMAKTTATKTKTGTTKTKTTANPANIYVSIWRRFPDGHPCLFKAA